MKGVNFLRTAVIILSIVSGALLIALGVAVLVIHALRRNAKRNTQIDKMTGLLNRDGFMRAGNEILRHNKVLAGDYALFVFDVDHLGMVNTLFGVERGDSVVRAFAGAVKSLAGKTGLCGRVNTDDFALLVKLQGEEISEVIERFSGYLYSVIPENRLRDKVNFFAGVCIYDGADDIYTLYNKANLCLMTKRGGLRVTEFTSDMENRMVENELLRSEMSEALEKGQFELYYQPKVSFKTGKILGVEALIRWHHPTKGFVPPTDFIPIAEEFGIITRIDEWGLITACRQGKKWMDKGLPPVKISVNMSQAQFQRTDVYASVVKALEETGFDPHYLEIEVTETMAMLDAEHMAEILSKIHSLGVSISIDDFGTGYSSLSSLKTIPFDVLKIDRSLVCDVSENDTSRRITGAIVAMGKALRMVVLAEGVETDEQNRLLSEIGCDLAQGYYYSKPCPASEIETMLILPVGENTAG